MRKLCVAIFATFVAVMLSAPVQAESTPIHKRDSDRGQSKFKNSTCHAPTWERLTLVMLDANMKHEETSVDSFTCEGGEDDTIGRKFFCDNLVARFAPEKYKKVESRFDLKDACEEAKKIAKKRLEAYNDSRCFVVTRHDKIGKYNFSKKAFPVEDLNARGVPVEVPERYEELDINWPSNQFNVSWYMSSFRLTVPQVIDKIKMKPEKAEKFAANNDKVFVKYELTLNGDYEMQRSGISNGNYKVEAWMYESEEMENLLAKDRSFDALGFTSNSADDT